MAYSSSAPFQSLTTQDLGRLLIYIPVVTSSMDVLDKLSLFHGLVVVPRYQTNGSGRSKNRWLSADGCLMFTIQLKIGLGSVIGQRIPLIQHLMATALVNCILREAEYQVSETKWPFKYVCFSLLSYHLLSLRARIYVPGN